MSKPNLTDEEFDKLAAGMGAGAKEVETNWPDAVDWDNYPVLGGVVVEVEALTIDNRATHRASIQTPDGVVSLWESASLIKLFVTLKAGDQILVKYTGMKDLAGSKQQRQFRVVHKPGKA